MDDGTIARLVEYASQFQEDFMRAEQARLVGPYLRGLLSDGARKIIEPMVNRLGGWEELGLGDPVQAVRHFVGHGHWAHEQSQRSSARL